MKIILLCLYRGLARTLDVKHSSTQERFRSGHNSSGGGGVQRADSDADRVCLHIHLHLGEAADGDLVSGRRQGPRAQ